MNTLLILLSHAFNPLIIAFYISLRNKTDTGTRRNLQPDDVIVIILSSWLIYFIWLAVHFLGAWMTGRSFSFPVFIGTYQGTHYFFPFMGGLTIIFAESVLRPILRAPMAIEIYRAVYVLIVFLSSYMMLVNYLAALS
jgi:hypothetical protein